MNNNEFLYSDEDVLLMLHSHNCFHKKTENKYEDAQFFQIQQNLIFLPIKQEAKFLYQSQTQQSDQNNMSDQYLQLSESLVFSEFSEIQEIERSLFIEHENNESQSEIQGVLTFINDQRYECLQIDEQNINTQQIDEQQNNHNYSQSKQYSYLSEQQEQIQQPYSFRQQLPSQNQQIQQQEKEYSPYLQQSRQQNYFYQPQDQQQSQYLKDKFNQNFQPQIQYEQNQQQQYLYNRNQQNRQKIYKFPQEQILEINQQYNEEDIQYKINNIISLSYQNQEFNQQSIDSIQNNNNINNNSYKPNEESQFYKGLNSSYSKNNIQYQSKTSSLMNQSRDIESTEINQQSFIQGYEEINTSTNKNDTTQNNSTSQQQLTQNNRQQKTKKIKKQEKQPIKNKTPVTTKNQQQNQNKLTLNKNKSIIEEQANLKRANVKEIDPNYSTQDKQPNHKFFEDSIQKIIKKQEISHPKKENKKNPFNQNKSDESKNFIILTVGYIISILKQKYSKRIQQLQSFIQINTYKKRSIHTLNRLILDVINLLQEQGDIEELNRFKQNIINYDFLKYARNFSTKYSSYLFFKYQISIQMIFQYPGQFNSVKQALKCFLELQQKQ